MPPINDKIQKGYYNEANDEGSLLDTGAVAATQNGGGATPVGSTPAQSILPTRQEGQTDSEYLDAWLNYAKANQPERAEVKQKRERMERTQGIVNGLSDLGRAIANMYFTTQYAPNGYDESKSLTAAHQARLERARKERSERSAEYMKAIERVQKYKDSERTFNINQQKQELAQKKWEAEEERKNALNQARVESYNAMTKYREAIANKNDAQAKLYQEQVVFLQAKIRYLELGYNLKQAESQARIEAQEALAEQRRREADGTTTTTIIERDRFGNETGRTVTKTPNGGNAAAGGGNGDGASGGSDAPPSRQKKAQGSSDDDTPPSRRK